MKYANNILKILHRIRPLIIKMFERRFSYYVLSILVLIAIVGCVVIFLFNPSLEIGIAICSLIVSLISLLQGSDANTSSTNNKVCDTQALELAIKELTKAIEQTNQTQNFNSNNNQEK